LQVIVDSQWPPSCSPACVRKYLEGAKFNWMLPAACCLSGWTKSTRIASNKIRGWSCYAHMTTAVYQHLEKSWGI
jgi:hypothetical protein